MLAAALIGVALLGLLGWQLHRERMVKACLSTGGAWTGHGCGPNRSPILLRDLRRS
jgi:hypothetical protein